MSHRSLVGFFSILLDREAIDLPRESSYPRAVSTSMEIIAYSQATKFTPITSD